MSNCKEKPAADLVAGLRTTGARRLSYDADASSGLSPLGLAAKLVETTAYEVAGTASTSLVSELILISARLSTIDQQIDPARRR